MRLHNNEKNDKKRTLAVGVISTGPLASTLLTRIISLTLCPPVRRRREGVGVIPRKWRVTVMKGDSRVDHTCGRECEGGRRDGVWEGGREDRKSVV